MPGSQVVPPLALKLAPLLILQGMFVGPFRTTFTSAWGIAALYASLGDIDDAFAWLETAIEEKASGLILLRVHPRLDPIRNDPRYWPMVERVGLAD